MPGESVTDAVKRLGLVYPQRRLLTGGDGNASRARDLELRGRTIEGYHDIPWYKQAVDNAIGAIAQDIEEKGIAKTVAKYTLIIGVPALMIMTMIKNVNEDFSIQTGGGDPIEEKVEAYIRQQADPCMEAAFKAALHMSSFDPKTGDISAEDLAKLLFIVADHLPQMKQRVMQQLTAPQSPLQLTATGGSKTRRSRHSRRHRRISRRH